MKKKIPVRVAGAFLVAGALVCTASCGYKTPPVSPDTVVPMAIEDLRYTLEDGGIQLNWSYPVETVKGSVIEDISRFDLYKAEIAMDEYCPTCPIPFGAPIELAGGPCLDGEQRRKASYDFGDVRSGYKYFFKVRSRKGWIADSEDSNIVSFVYYRPASSPEGLSGVAGDGEIKLSWQPVTTLSDGSRVVGKVSYQVLRSVGGKDFLPLGEAVDGVSFTDTSVRNGQKYFYTVKSLMEYQGEIVEGSVSEDISVTPVDLTPPVPPGGIRAISVSRGTKIFWERVDSSDLGGYKVYRRPANRDDYTLLATVDPAFASYVDLEGNGSVRYYYAITAIDKATPPNESVKSREATVR
ncbi:MAG: hypothetical protein CSA26_11635 [Desulfobacterales bacterium]|nr:MAG: hypothetical protein CSA26_11635 [Desulfobacterales bacterium]